VEQVELAAIEGPLACFECVHSLDEKLFAMMDAFGKMFEERANRALLVEMTDTSSCQHNERNSQALEQPCYLIVSSSKAVALANVQLDRLVLVYSSSQSHLRGLVKRWAARKLLDMEVEGEERLGDQLHCHLEQA
jgi:hypothetical protein